MKTFRILIALFIFIITACSSNSVTTAGNNPLVGTFIGGNPDRACGAMWWKVVRYENGSYFITFYLDEKRTIIKSFEQGQWWVKDGYFYEIAPKYMDKPDVFNVTLLNENEIEFTSSKFDESTACKENYKFVDHRVIQ